MKNVFYLVRRLVCRNLNSNRSQSIAGTIAILSIAFSTQAQNTWTQEANFGGSARDGAVAFVIRGKGYVGTGRDNGGLKNDFWEYDPSTDTWTQKANFGGTPRSCAVGFSIDSSGYIGTGSANDGLKNDFWQYDPAANLWIQKTNFMGMPRACAVGFAIDSKGYIGTGEGSSTSPFSDFWEYKPSTNAWTRKADFAGAARTFAVGFSIGDKGYVGTGDCDGSYSNDFWQYDPATNLWTQKENFGGAFREGAVGFSINDKGYIGTGYYLLGIINDFWEYNSLTDIWTQKSSFGGTARGYAVGFSISGKGYIGTGIGSMYFNDFWEYKPDTSCIQPYSKITALGNLDICAAGSVNLEATGGTSYKYQWTINSVSIRGATNRLYRAKTTGKYQVNITNNIGCSSVSKGVTVSSSCRLEQDAEQAFNLYPNPSSGTFHLDLTTVDEGNVEAKIEVLNALGQIIFSDHAQFSQGKLLKEIKLNGASPGMYLVKVIAGDLVYTSQISLQK